MVSLTQLRNLIKLGFLMQLDLFVITSWKKTWLQQVNSIHARKVRFFLIFRKSLFVGKTGGRIVQVFCSRGDCFGLFWKSANHPAEDDICIVNIYCIEYCYNVVFRLSIPLFSGYHCMIKILKGILLQVIYSILFSLYLSFLDDFISYHEFP